MNLSRKRWARLLLVLTLVGLLWTGTSHHALHDAEHGQDCAACLTSVAGPPPDLVLALPVTVQSVHEVACHSARLTTRVLHFVRGPPAA